MAVQVLFKIEKRLKSDPLEPPPMCPRAEVSWKRLGDGKTPIAFEAAASKCMYFFSSSAYSVSMVVVRTATVT